LIKQKHYKDAIDHLKPATEAAPRDTDTLFNLGYAYFMAKDNANAVSTLKNETKQRASDGEALYVLSKTLAAEGDQAAASTASDQAKKLLPSFAQWETKGLPALARVKPALADQLLSLQARSGRAIEPADSDQQPARASRSAFETARAPQLWAGRGR
jgi:tetratricopeptide (TPR) repeat protein